MNINNHTRMQQKWSRVLDSKKVKPAGMFAFKLQEAEPDTFTIEMSSSPIETKKKYTSNLYKFSIKVKKIYNSQ